MAMAFDWECRIEYTGVVSYVYQWNEMFGFRFPCALVFAIEFQYERTGCRLKKILQQPLRGMYLFGTIVRISGLVID
jgi:hypothetical protein